MFNLTLNDDSDPPKVLQTKQICEETVKVGRDPASGWVIDDPSRLVSRHHLDLWVSNATLLVRATGRHNVYVGNPPRKLEKGVETEIRVGESVSLGLFKIMVESSEVLSVGTAPGGGSELSEVSRLNYALFEAFCDGAEVDPSQFIAEDPSQILREVGAVYRQAITSLSKLLRSRSEIRAEILADRTMIGSRDNNLLKWAPTHRVAIDLLTNKQEAFLAGAKAVKFSFDDLDNHIDDLLAGHRTALKELLECLRPSSLEKGAPRGILRDRRAESWEAFTRVHAELESELTSDTQSALGSGFADGYERHAHKKRA